MGIQFQQLFIICYSFLAKIAILYTLILKEMLLKNRIMKN